VHIERPGRIHKEGYKEEMNSPSVTSKESMKRSSSLISARASCEKPIRQEEGEGKREEEGKHDG